MIRRPPRSTLTNTRFPHPPLFRSAVGSLADPARRNALTLPMTTEIVDTFDALEANPAVGAVVITGEPPAFCAGADLSHLSSSADGGAESGLRAIYEGFLRIGRSPLPTIAAVNGAAVGAGMTLALVSRSAARRLGKEWLSTC